MPTQTRPEPVDYHVLRLMVGLVAIGLASATSLLSPLPLESISASYHVGGAARDVLVGFLVAVGAIMLAHNGNDRGEQRLSKIAAISAFGVALFPCDCGEGGGLVPSVHYTSAAVMFTVLAVFCWGFYRRARDRRARDEGNKKATARAALYFVCGVAIIVATTTLLADYLSGGLLRARIARLVFFGEAIALLAFGAAWLTASRTLPLLTAEQERIRLW